jgi:hypothetical protein
MSTIKVNNIVPPNVGEGVSIDGLQMPTAGALSNRSLIINGAMAVSQRGTTFNYSGTGQTVAYKLDRWKTACFGAYPSGDYLEITQDTDVPSIALAGTKFSKSHKLKALQNIPVSATEARGIWIQQAIEGQNIEHLGFGAANASTVTLSFWVKATKTGTFSVAIKSSSSDLGYVSTVTIGAANTWQYCTKTIPGPTTGTFNTDNSSGCSLHFTWDLDPTWLATATTDQWVAGNIVGTTTQSNMLSATNDAVWVTGVQLEVGSKATPFELESYGQTLQKCKRYYQRLDRARGSAKGSALGTDQMAFSHHLGVEMNHAPDVIRKVETRGGCSHQQYANVRDNHISALVNVSSTSYWYYNDGYEADAEL